jgi:hypothetical protein
MKLILTTSVSGSGHLKARGVADRVVVFEHRLVWGAVPAAADPGDFFLARDALSKADPTGWAYWEEWAGDTAVGAEDLVGYAPGRTWSELISICRRFEAVEIWPDPIPNAQLVLVQLLDRLGRHPEVLEKLVLVHSDTPLGELDSEEAAQGATDRRRVEPDHLALAEAAWRAFTQPTPRTWLSLLDGDLSVLPHLRRAVLALLQELPDARTGLGATEARILEVIAPGAVAPFDVFPGYEKNNALDVLDYWEVGRTLDQLARCPAPAVSGLDEGPFTLAMHADRHRLHRYQHCALSLTGLGVALVAGAADFSEHNPISRWWGGGRLNNDQLWRWDDVHRRLVAPGRATP